MGPLAGLRIIEMAGIGPAPFCAMMLADMGARVLRIEKPGGSSVAGIDAARDVLLRGRERIVLDLKQPAAVRAVLGLCAGADGLLEGFRPGVMERLGLGPETCMAANPKLVYGRMTGWGQDGPLAAAAGHDINYIALTGALDAIGEAGRGPLPPLNLVGDFGGGGMMLAFGIMCGLWEAGRSGQGQVIDAAMIDGAALLMASFHGLAAQGLWPGGRGHNLLDGGAPFYRAYQTADGRYISIGPLEPPFFRRFLDLTGLPANLASGQYDAAAWPALRAAIDARIGEKTLAEWDTLLAGSDVCYAPVLTLDEVAGHPHNRARDSYVKAGGITQPAPAPRFSRSKPRGPEKVMELAENPTEILSRWGLPADLLDNL